MDNVIDGITIRLPRATAAYNLDTSNTIIYVSPRIQSASGDTLTGDTGEIRLPYNTYTESGSTSDAVWGNANSEKYYAGSSLGIQQEAEDLNQDPDTYYFKKVQEALDSDKYRTIILDHDVVVPDGSTLKITRAVDTFNLNGFSIQGDVLVKYSGNTTTTIQNGSIQGILTINVPNGDIELQDVTYVDEVDVTDVAKNTLYISGSSAVRRVVIKDSDMSLRLDSTAKITEKVEITPTTAGNIILKGNGEYSNVIVNQTTSITALATVKNLIVNNGATVTVKKDDEGNETAHHIVGVTVVGNAVVKVEAKDGTTVTLDSENAETYLDTNGVFQDASETSTELSSKVTAATNAISVYAAAVKTVTSGGYNTAKEEGSAVATKLSAADDAIKAVAAVTGGALKAEELNAQLETVKTEFALRSVMADFISQKITNSTYNFVNITTEKFDASVVGDDKTAKVTIGNVENLEMYEEGSTPWASLYDFKHTTCSMDITISCDGCIYTETFSSTQLD